MVGVLAFTVVVCDTSAEVNGVAFSFVRQSLNFKFRVCQLIFFINGSILGRV
jgi:hypothetical protein